MGDWRNYVYGKEGQQKRIQFDKEIKDSVDKYQSSHQQELQQQAINNAKIQSTVKPQVQPVPYQDNGFWAKVRNLNLEDTPLVKTLAAPMEALYKIPLIQRIAVSAGNTIAGPGALKNNDSTDMQPMDAGKVGNKIADLVGTGLGYSVPIGGLNNSLQGSASKIMQPIEKYLPQATSKLGQYGVNALRSGAEFAGLNTAQSVAKGDNLNDTLNSAKEGFIGGAAFGTLAKGLGDIGKSALPNWKTTYEGSGMIAKPEMNLKPIRKDIANKIVSPEVKSLNDTSDLLDGISKKELFNKIDSISRKTYKTIEDVPEYNKLKKYGIDIPPADFLDMKDKDITNYLNAREHGLNHSQSIVYQLVKRDTHGLSDKQLIDRIKYFKDNNIDGIITPNMQEYIKHWNSSDGSSFDTEPLKPRTNTNIPIAEIKPTSSAIKPLNTKDLQFKTTGVEMKKPSLELDYNKINDADFLQKHIADLETAITTADEPTRIKMNLQLFAAKERLKALSKFVTNSIQNSAIAPQAMKDTIKAPPYIKITNQDTWNNAVKTVEDNPQKSLQDYFNSKELKSADDTALGQALIVKAIKEGRIADANEISIDLAEKLSRAGQTVQAASIFKRLTPEGMLQYANNVVNRVNKVIEKETGLKDSMKKVKLTDDEANKILEGMKEYQKMPEGDAKNIKLGQIMQIINDKQPSSLVDKIRAVRNISLLGNAKTNVRNVAGNAIMGVADNTSNTIGTPIDWMVSKKTGQRAVGLPNLGIQAKGFAKGTGNAIQDSFGGLKLSDLKGKTFKEKVKIVTDGLANPIDRNLNSNGKFEMGNRLAFNNKPMRIAENSVGTLLKVGDNSFKQAYKDDVLNQLMKANKVTTPTDEMIAIADQIANERTYQDNNSITKLAMGVKNLPQKLENGKLKDATQIFVDSQLPYVKTPANLLKRAVEYTPVGILDGGAKLNTLFKNGAKNGVYDMALQRKAVDRLSRGLVGTALMGAGAYGAKKGLLTGSAAKDKDMAAFDQQNGKQPYAVKVGDKYYNYDWAQPMSMPLSGGVQMTQGKKGQPVTNAMDAVSNALTFYSEQPMLQSIQKLLGSPNDSKNIGQRAVEAALQLPNQFVPTALKQITQMTDNNVRSNYSPNLIEKTVINPIKSKIPGLSNSLPTKVDTLGNEVKQYQGNNNLFNVAINPGNLTTKKNDATIQMIEDIYNKTGSSIQVPRLAGNTITYTDSKTKKSTTIDLTGQEVQDLQKYIGDKTAQEYAKIANGYSTNITKDAAQKKAQQLQSILTKIYNEGESKVLQNKGLHEYKK